MRSLTELLFVGGAFALLGCAATHQGKAAPKSAVHTAAWEHAQLARATDFINLGVDCLRDSLWYEAGENLDSAIAQLNVLDSADSLSPALRIATKALRDTVQSLLVTVVDESGELEENNPIAEVTDEEIDESTDSASHQFDSLSRSLDYSQFDLPLPKPIHPRIRQALAYFTGPAHSVFAKWLTRKSRYESFLRSHLESRGMPKDLMYLAMVESGFNPRAWSHARASGMWQFISGTGRRYGLKDDFWIDPRRDFVAATEAALSYLEALHGEFDDWNLAMASYNCGENRVRRLLAKDSSLNYWTMPLPAETRFYVPKILAAMIIGHNPERFGFTIESPESPLVFDTVTVNDCLPISTIAKAVGVREEQIIDLNPGLRRWCTPPNRQKHVVYLPFGTREAFVRAYDAMDKSKLLSWKQHEVQRGDNLGGIAAKYGVSVEALRSVNHGIKPSRLRVGQNLIIPVPASGGTGELEAEIQREAEDSPKRQLQVTYRVKKGDNLFDIARQFGISINALRAANSLGARDHLLAGQLLRVPRRGARSGDFASDGVERGTKQFHPVIKGETLFSVSQALGVSVGNLKRWNHIRGNQVLLGQKLTYYSEEGDKPFSKGPSVLAQTAISTPDEPVSKTKPIAKGEHRLDSPTVVTSGEKSKSYEVKAGESLYHIAKINGLTVNELVDLNGIETGETIHPGDSLRVTGPKRKLNPKSSKGLGVSENPEQWYVVKSGDTLWDISQRFQSSVEQIRHLNQNLAANLKPGTRIRVR